MKSSILSALVMGVILTTVAWGNDARSTQTTNSQAAALPPGCDLGKISQASLALAQNQNTYLAEVVDQMQNVQQEFTQLDSWQSSNAGRTLQYDGVFAQEAQVAAGLVTKAQGWQTDLPTYLTALMDAVNPCLPQSR